MIGIEAQGLEWIEALSRMMEEEALIPLVAQQAEAARSEWVRLAQTELNLSRQDYIAGIQPVALHGAIAQVDLLGEFPNQVEQGAESWDLRETILTSPKAKRSQLTGARYMSIPFRHQTPGSRGTQAQVMGAAYGPRGASSQASPHTVLKDHRQLGKDVYKRAARLRPGQGLRAGLAPLLRPWHATDIFAGMRKFKADGPGAKKSSTNIYMSFRTISENEPTGWIHPGIQARNLSARVAQYSARVAPDSIETYIRNMMGHR